MRDISRADGYIDPVGADIIRPHMARRVVAPHKIGKIPVNPQTPRPHTDR